MSMDLELTKELYQTLAEAARSGPEAELAMGELFEHAEGLGGEELRRLVATIGGKALMRSDATEFRTSPPSDEDGAQIRDEAAPEEISMVPHRRIYAYSYEMEGPTDEEAPAEHRTEGVGRGDLSSVYTMYVEDETGIPVCACSQIARGGVICHHMMLHALRSGSGDETVPG